MGFSISHGGTTSTLSGTQIYNLGQKLRPVASSFDWAAIALLFAPRSGDPFEVKPGEAERIGTALHRAAKSLRFWDRGWAAMAHQIADSALRAARSNEKWVWS